MSPVELNALLPLLVLAAGATLTLVLPAFIRRPAVTALMGAFTLAVFLSSIQAQWSAPTVDISGLLTVDSFARLFWALLGASTLVVLVFNHGASAASGEPGGETHGLFLLATLGGCVMVASQHFASFFMGLELLSVSLFILVAWQCRSALSIEAGIKYLVLAGLATGFMLFGMALVYAASGTLGFAALDGLAGRSVTDAWWQFGLALILLGVVFKLSLVPFHFWTADVYQGAPAPVTAFLASVSKAAVLGLLVRFSLGMDMQYGSSLWWMLAVLAAASMLAGNWLALRQNDLKRLLAWSSVAHMGYALAALLVGGALAVEAVLFYVFFYLLATLAVFGVVAVLQLAGEQTPSIRALHGLARREPMTALVMTVSLLSLAGVPLTAGFLGKFYVLAGGAAEGLWWLMAVVIAGSAIGLFYYLRVMLALYTGESGAVPVSIPRVTLLCLVAITLGTLWLGVYPQPGVTLAEQVAGELMPMDTPVASRR